MAGETLAFQQTLQWAFQQYRKMNKFYENEQLKEKIKERGSLYGVPSTEFSQERELEELMARMPTMITKPNNLFDKGELEKRYRLFQHKTRAIQEEEEMKRQRDEAAAKMPHERAASMDDDLFGGGPGSSKMLIGANVMMAGNPHQLAVGKPKRQIVQSLDQKEKDYMRTLIQDETSRYNEEVNKKYHDKFNCKTRNSY